ncbi:MAG: AAA family ATPase [Clostridia bacterium]|nr:AAA family ATPase [Clostridia bacterium]
MIYLEEFRLPDVKSETGYIIDTKSAELNMQCYDLTSAYPFNIFPKKRFERIGFSDVTMFYGLNGSGKSTILNVIAEKLRIRRSTGFNDSPSFEAYLRLCSYDLSPGRKIPRESEIITSDGVFDYLLDLRAINEGVERRRAELFEEYSRERNVEHPLMGLDDYEAFKNHNEANRMTKSRFTAERMDHVNIPGKSNGETAFGYFTHRIRENALYLLDEPENSLSAPLQNELKRFIADSARFYKCQFIIATHSPFLLSIPGAKIYDLSETPVVTKDWKELETVKLYKQLFD